MRASPPDRLETFLDDEWTQIVYGLFATIFTRHDRVFVFVGEHAVVTNISQCGDHPFPFHVIHPGMKIDGVRALLKIVIVIQFCVDRA